MAITDILASAGDGQDFIVEVPAGNGAYVPTDALFEANGALMCVEIPAAANTGGNIFIMSE